MYTKIKLFVSAIILIAVGCSSKKEKIEPVIDVIENAVIKEEDTWISLFNGVTVEGWRGYNQSELPSGWLVEEGTLKSVGQGGDIGGDIIYGSMEFENFELYMEWKISEGGNSGIFYHVIEGKQFSAPYLNAPEYQLLDDFGFPEPVEDWQQLGADYAMYPADPEKKIVKKSGEWNTSRIIFTKTNVEYWLNGAKVVQFVPWSDDWHQRRNSGKWEDKPEYGKAKKGYIGLQYLGSFIWFRNIKVKKL